MSATDTADSGKAFSGKRVLVTGAGKGIGRATAALLAARGASVVALSRSADDLHALERAIGCETHAVDLADAAAARAAAQAAQPIDLLVNNAGIARLQPFLECDVDAFDETMAVNVRAAMIVGQVCARSMIERGVGGAIVNVSSISAQIGFALHAAYCASKAALDALTRVMAVELGPQGIRVNTVNPTVTLTPMAEQAWSDPAKASQMLSRIPLNRFAKPEEVAQTIAYLLGDEARMINGVSLAVDGGFLAR
ncbi:MAG TPA: SDR family oxidoreductase [Trinickia sp.]|uniref:SDR family oxidoreductase n=1 Tax=Trinickia sp. TaxID=2571163 RepID=UPI002C35FE2D|nr:SDR family oxidoreductase [Trinickia sp.]HVW48849.1 SDR family oxidoreductase [Trinickia sp.]